jgi:hypothetical protein
MAPAVILLNLTHNRMRTNACCSAQFTPLCEQEIQTTRGGIAPLLLAIVAGAAVAGTAQIFRDWENFKAGLAGKPPAN